MSEFTTLPIPGTPFTAFAFAAAGGSAQRTMPDRLSDVRNVRDFGAVGDGSTDDTAAINACFAAALTGGVASGSVTTGGIVFFPPGAYKVTSSLSAADWVGSVSIEGSGMYNTMLTGDINGFILDKPDGTGAVIQSIRNICVVNRNTTIGSGALRFGFVSSANLESLNLQGMIGLDAGADQFQCRYANIVVGPTFENQVPGSIGIIGGNATFVGCNVLGFDTGYLIGSITYPLTNAGAPACNLIGCRAEVCNIGFNLGKNILGNLSGAGVMMEGCQSERCYETIVASNVAPFSVLGGSFTGTRGPGKYFHLDIGGSLTWSSAGGGKATVVIPAAMPSLDDYGWSAGTRSICMDSAVPSGYNTSGFVTGTRTGARSFTYPVASNPGGPNTDTWALWSFKCQSGIKMLGAELGSISGVAFGFADLEVAALDWTSFDGGLLTVENTIGSWALPPSQRKAGISVKGCSIGNLSMNYADLPGGAGVWVNALLGGPLEGMEYDIVDCNTAAWGATAAGGGSNHVKLRYNGSAWTVVGK